MGEREGGACPQAPCHTYTDLAALHPGCCGTTSERWFRTEAVPRLDSLTPDVILAIGSRARVTIGENIRILSGAFFWWQW